MQLRYTGTTALTIPAARLHLNPGDLFDVPDPLADELVARGDFKLAAAAPVAKVAEVLAAVGDDPAEAAKALAEELAQARPRKSLVAQLEALAATTADPDPIPEGATVAGLDNPEE